jgi:chaperonin cofactor prefoldin
MFFVAQDDAFAQVRSLTTQLQEVADEKERVELRFQQLQQSLGEVEEGRCRDMAPF